MTKTLNERHEMITRAGAAFNRLMIATHGDTGWMNTAERQLDIVRGICVVPPTRLERWDAVQALECMVHAVEAEGASW